MALTAQFLGRRITDASSITDWGVSRVDGGGGQSWTNIAVNTAEAIQGGSCVSAESTANADGKVVFFAYDVLNAEGASLDFSPGGGEENSPIWIWAKIIAPQSTGSATTLPGLSVGLSSAGAGTPADTDTAWWTFYGIENYPGSWVRMVINPSITLPTASGASFSLASVSHVGMVGTTQTSKGSVEVGFVDAIDIGSGIQVFGDVDTAVYGQDGFLEIFNSGESDTNKYGAFESVEDTQTVFKVRGQVLIGDASGTNTTNFTGTDSILVFDAPQYINSTNADFTNALGDDFQKMAFEGNATNPTNIQLGISAGAGDNTRGRNGVIFLGNDDYFINMDFNDGNVNSLYFYGCTVRNFDDPAGTVADTVTWTATGSHGFFGSVWDKCRELNPDSGVTIRNSTFLNHDYQGIGVRGSINWNSTTPPDDQIIDIKNCSFIANDYAISHIESGTYIYDNLSFSDNTFDIYFAGDLLGEDLIINATNGTLTTLSATTGNPGDTVTVTATVTLTITGFVDNSELYARDATDATIGIVERFNEESAVGNYQYVYNDPGSDIDLFVMKNQTSPTDTGYQWLSIRDFTLPNTAQTLQIFQIIERNSNIF